MQGVQLNFDASNVKVEDRFEAIPAGWYNATVTNTERKPSKQNENNSYLEVEHTIMDGQFAGRKLFNRINLWNADQTATEIAYKGANGLAALQQALGVFQCSNSQQLHGIPLKVKVKVKPAGKGNDGKDYEAGNEIIKYAHVTAQVGDEPGVGGSIATGVPGAASGNPPWATAGAAPAPAQAAPPATGGQPWEQGAQGSSQAPPWAQQAAAAAPAPAAVAAPPPPNTATSGPVMLPAANGLSYESYKKSGWTDEQLVANGLMAAPAAPPAPAAASAPPPPTQTANGAKPPWAT